MIKNLLSGVISAIGGGSPRSPRNPRSGASRGYYLFFALALLVTLLRFLFVLDVPEQSTDVLRNLGFTSHFWELGPSIYNYKASDFHPEIWTDLWGGGWVHISSCGDDVFCCFRVSLKGYHRFKGCADCL